jgi:hypothetical protein
VVIVRLERKTDTDRRKPVEGALESVDRALS